MTRLFDVAVCPTCGSDRLALIDIDEASRCQDCGETLVRASPAAAWERFAEYFGRESPPKRPTRQRAR